MEDIALHIMDIVDNSIAGGSSSIEIRSVETGGRLVISIIDDGVGMSPEQVQKASDPFFTTKVGKRVGLGLSLFRQAAEATGGSLTVTSNENGGTTVCAEFVPGHSDMKPLGDLAETVSLLRVYHPEISFTFTQEPIASRGGAE